MAGIFPILANKAYYQVANFKWEKWWAWQGLNLRPLRCQHSALPLSYTPTRGSAGTIRRASGGGL